MDLPHQHRYQDQTSAKVYFDTCLDTFNSLPLNLSSPATSSSASSTSSADTLVSQQQQHSTNPNKRPHRAMDRTQQQQHQQQHPQRQHQQTESVSSSSTAVDFTNMPFGGVPSMPLIMAEALAREGFTEYAEVLAFKQDQRQLEQVTVQSALEHQQYASSSSSYSPQEHQNQRRQQQQHQQLQQQQQTLQDDSYLFNFVVQEHNMIMAQHGYNNTNNGSSSSSSTAPYPAAMQGASDAAVDLQDPNNPYSFMGDMPLLEVMQYNSLLLDNNYIDDLPTSIIQGGCGADGPGMDPTSWCDSPQAFGFGGNYIGDQFSQQINIQQLPQQSQLQQQQQQSFQQGGGYFDPSASSSSSSAGSSSSSSSSSASSSSSGPGYGFGLPIWSAMQSGLLYPQGDFLLERKREGAAGLGHDLLQVPNGAVFAPPGARVQPPLEPAEEDDSDDDDDDDAEEYGEMEDDSPPGMIMDHQSHHHHQQQQQQQHYQQQQQQQLPYGAAFPGGYLPGDESHVPPLSMPGSRSSHRLSGTKHDREEEHNTMGMNNGLMKRSKSDAATSSVAAAAAAAAAARRASAASSHSHSRNSSMSSIHSHSPKMESPSSSFSGSPSSSYQNSNSHQQKAPRPPMETIEKRMHPCTFEGCTKSFTRAFNLRSHLNTHNGERPHRCPEPGCEWDFVRRHDLDRHVKSKHMANKPYACRQCTSRFGRSDALQRHRRLENHI